ncbi:hypothetical protein GOODEAATRI_028499 [Goodea atripinnis]|uniref:Uncharacterized protein n=1 Tax=Goodea atripinnis TaxID=208336 RepID=A0ABV0MVX4_9TELE
MAVFNIIAAVPTHLSESQVEVWTLIGSLQQLDSLCFQPFCYRSSAVFGIIVLLMTQFGKSFSCWIGGLILDSRILWYEESWFNHCKTSPHHQPSTTVPDCCELWSNISTLVSSVPQVLCFIQLQLCKMKVRFSTSDQMNPFLPLAADV